MMMMMVAVMEKNVGDGGNQGMLLMVVMEKNVGDGGSGRECC